MEKITPQEARVRETIDTMGRMLESHNCICVGVSGGSDSNIIVHMIVRNFPQYLSKVHFEFQNTGMEFAATHRHLKYMEKTYGIEIDYLRPGKGNTVQEVVPVYGLPMVSKQFSHTMASAFRGAKSALDKIFGRCKTKTGEKSKFNFTPKQKALAQYCLQYKILCSDVCCDIAKKAPLKKYIKQIGADLSISGERRGEGGARADAHDSCFEPGAVDKYMPLYLWSDKDKEYYKKKENIIFSDCYEVYGMKRTGCAGCPFNSNVGEELEIMQKYEPALYKMSMKVFGLAYKLMDKFCIHRRRILEKQLTMDKWEEEQEERTWKK